MRRFLVTVFAAVLFTPSAFAHSRLLIGVADYGSHSEPEAAMGYAHTLGLNVQRVSLWWKVGQSRVSNDDAALLNRWTQAAVGTRLFVTVSGASAYDGSVAQQASGREDFCRYAASAAALPGVYAVEIGNEFNLPLFSLTRDPAGYERTLARCYDAVHAASQAKVIGMALAYSRLPFDYATAVTRAYRASGRAKPIMDLLSQHAYGLGDTGLTRLLAVYRVGFKGTAQQVPSKQHPTLWLTEDGFDSSGSHHNTFFGLSEAEQAIALVSKLRWVRSRAEVGAWVNLQMWDISDAPWSAGFLRADMSPKPSWDAVRSWVAGYTSRRMATYTPAAVVGMTSLTATPGTSVLTGAGGTTYIIRTVHVDTNAAAKTFTLSIGADAAGTRLWDAYALTANVPAIFNGWWVKAGVGAHDIDSSVSATTVTLMASGYTYA